MAAATQIRVDTLRERMEQERADKTPLFDALFITLMLVMGVWFLLGLGVYGWPWHLALGVSFGGCVGLFFLAAVIAGLLEGIGFSRRGSSDLIGWLLVATSASIGWGLFSDPAWSGALLGFTALGPFFVFYYQACTRHRREALFDLPTGVLQQLEVLSEDLPRELSSVLDKALGDYLDVREILEQEDFDYPLDRAGLLESADRALASLFSHARSVGRMHRIAQRRPEEIRADELYQEAIEQLRHEGLQLHSMAVSLLECSFVAQSNESVVILEAHDQDVQLVTETLHEVQQHSASHSVKRCS